MCMYAAPELGRTVSCTISKASAMKSARLRPMRFVVLGPLPTKAVIDKLLFPWVGLTVLCNELLYGLLRCRFVASVLANSTNYNVVFRRTELREKPDQHVYLLAFNSECHSMQSGRGIFL